MKTTISRLYNLQTLELQSPKKRSSEAQTLREQIPSEMLVRFDRFLTRGKKGVAVVQNGVCKGCQIALPVGLVNALIQGETAQVCGNCGRYLYLSDVDADAFRGGMRSDTITVAKAKVPALAVKTTRPRRKASKTITDAAVTSAAAE